MPATIPSDVVRTIEALATSSNGDVPALVQQARAIAPGPFADDPTLAHAIELAGISLAEAGNRNASWWLACAIAILRPSTLANAQEDAQLTSSRWLHELAHSALAQGPIPESACWLVAGNAQPAPGAATLELARRNAITHLERLDAELTARTPLMRAQVEANGGNAQAIEGALASYESAATSTRAALRRACDHVLSRMNDPALEIAATTAMNELDDVILPTLRAHLAEARRVASEPAPVVAAMPSQAPVAMSLPDLEAAMRVAFEHAWKTRTPAARAAFENAVRARYQAETASIEDPDARQIAFDHYVTHALAQLP